MAAPRTPVTPCAVQAITSRKKKLLATAITKFYAKTNGSGKPSVTGFEALQYVDPHVSRKSFVFAKVLHSLTGNNIVRSRRQSPDHVSCP